MTIAMFYIVLATVLTIHSMDQTYTLSNTELTILHEEPGDLLQHRMVTLLQVKALRPRPSGQTKFMSWVLHLSAIGRIQLSLLCCGNKSFSLLS